MLELRNIDAGYNKKPVLNNVSMSLQKGEIVALIGPNGAGKSTVIKTVIGIVKARQGVILYKGNPINGNKPDKNIRQGIVYVPQGNTVFSDLSVLENLYMGGYILTDKNILETRIKEVFAIFPEIEERKNMDAGNLSGGEKQMLALSRALVLQPELLLLDEPSLGLSPKTIKKAFEGITTIREKFNTTILIVEQKVREVLEIADRVYVLAMGKVVLEDSAASLKDGSRIKKAFLGG